MTSRERVLAAVRREAVDRTPVTPYMGNYAAAVAGIPIDQISADPRRLTDAQVRAHELIGHDMLVAQSDGYYMAEALGMETRRRPNDTPVPLAWPVDDFSQIDALRVPDPRTGGRMPVYLAAIRMLREHAGEDIAVRACGTGPFSLAGHMLGPVNLVTELALLEAEGDSRAGQLRTLMEVCTETVIAFAKAALEAGADVVMAGDSLASLDMISPDIYRAWAQPYETTFFEEIAGAARARGALRLLHICGDTSPVLADMVATGADVIELDWKVSLAVARREAATVRGQEETPALMGNLDPSAVLLQGTSADVDRAARSAIQDAGEGFLLGSGCEVAPATPLENMRALVAAAT